MNFNAFVPLEMFRYPEGDEISFGNNILLTKVKPELDYSDISDYIAKKDLERIRLRRFWLKFNSNDEPKLSPSEIVNIFFLSLWIVKPTKANAKFRFSGKENNPRLSISIYYDFFQYNSCNVEEIFNKEDLILASTYFKILLGIVKYNKRLKNSLYFMLNGCFRTQWQVAYVTFCFAIEALLTYSKKPGLTKRLAISYSCLSSNANKQRNMFYKRFIKFYNVRSDIVHGRSYTYKKSEMNLKKLAKISNALRNLWKLILHDENLKNELEKSDDKREVFFRGIIGHYSPPQP